MGGGSWTTTAYNSYTCSTKGMDAVNYASLDGLNVQQAYKARTLHPDLNPYQITRLCRDSEEHPNTLPVILALDVTGSMGGAAVAVSQKLGPIMEDILSSADVADVEFCVMGIGDLYCDSAPIQMSQFESDVRIAEHLDKIFFEGGGGGNLCESYTAAWYMGVHHCDLDCWKRGRKGIIITLGDERINPALQKSDLVRTVGDSLQADVETSELYKEACDKFEIYHISVDDPESSYQRYNRSYGIDKPWKEILGDHYLVSTIQRLPQTISGLIIGEAEISAPDNTPPSETKEISW